MPRRYKHYPDEKWKPIINSDGCMRLLARVCKIWDPDAAEAEFLKMISLLTGLDYEECRSRWEDQSAPTFIGYGIPG